MRCREQEMERWREGKRERGKEGESKRWREQKMERWRDGKRERARDGKSERWREGGRGNIALSDHIVLHPIKFCDAIVYYIALFTSFSIA